MSAWKVTRRRNSSHDDADTLLWMHENTSTDVVTGCWNWTGNTAHAYGYGAMRFRGANDAVHRVAWKLIKGEIPPGKGVCHRCDNPRCWRPDHLFLGDQLANVRDMIEKGRRRAIGAIGEKNSHHKVSAEQVTAIRQRFAGGESAVSLGRYFGLNRISIHRIVRADNWLASSGAAGPVREGKRRAELVGEGHGNAKLTEAQVRAIRGRSASGERRINLSREFGISETHVTYILKRKAWAHLP